VKRLSLAAAATFYLQRRRRLGFALRETGLLLASLVRYGRQSHRRGPLTTAWVNAWAQQAPTARGSARRLQVARQFARFWALFDPRTQIPPEGRFGPAPRRRAVHIYSAAEIVDLLQAARRLSVPHSVAPDTLRALLGLLACTGLRISEALALRLSDWDPAEAVLTVRRSKFGRSRHVPLAPTAAHALDRFLQARPKTRAAATQSDAIFQNKRGQPLTYLPAQRAFAALCTQLRWNQSPKPRLHDLRHTFAVRCLCGWYRIGEHELNAKVLALAVYLGHRDIRHTYWYLSAVPELLALAMARRDGPRTTRKGASHA
jgi:integrase